MRQASKPACDCFTCNKIRVFRFHPRPIIESTRWLDVGQTVSLSNRSKKEKFLAQNSIHEQAVVTAWHRNLLVTAAIFTVLLISMGGVLCVTQSIRNCPDWPGCFGKATPPLETGPILEYTHRLLAGLSGLLILSAAITGLVRTPRTRWISIPPLVAVGLVIEVSFFGALVVLRGLSPGWAAVDVGSALLVVALMVTSAVYASVYHRTPALAHGLKFCSPFSRMVLTATLVVYILFVSGVLVAGKDPITACLGWPIYSPGLYPMNSPSVWYTLRILLSMIGIGLVIGVLVQAWRGRGERPDSFRYARWLGIAFLFEALTQLLLLVFGDVIYLLVVYTITAAVFWGLLVALCVRTGMEEKVV
jgi:cytochrome c oxidase assembly protein subunit 15